MPTPEFPSLTHVALTVRDLSVSVPWYETLLDAKPVLDELAKELVELALVDGHAVSSRSGGPHGLRVPRSSTAGGRSHIGETTRIRGPAAT